MEIIIAIPIIGFWFVWSYFIYNIGYDRGRGSIKYICFKNKPGDEDLPPPSIDFIF